MNIKRCLNDPMFAEAIKRVLANQNEEQPALEITQDLGRDPETDRPRSLGRAKRDLRKYIYELTRMQLTRLKLEDMLSDCGANKELVPV